MLTQEMIWKQLQLVRSRTLEVLEQIEESVYDIVPRGFNNSIRWNAGHILFVQDRLLLGLMGETLGVPAEYAGWFGNGTKPADWMTIPASKEKLLAQLREQPGRLQAQLDGRLDERLANPFRSLETVGEMAVYSLGHENQHNAIIGAYKRLVAVK